MRSWLVALAQAIGILFLFAAGFAATCGVIWLFLHAVVIGYTVIGLLVLAVLTFMFRTGDEH